MKPPLKPWLIRVVALGTMLTLPFVSLQAQTEPSATTTLNAQPTSPAQEIVRLVNAGVQREVLLGFIQNSNNLFNLTADDLIQLHNNGVPTEITTAMLQHDHALRQTTSTNQLTTATPVTTNAPGTGTPAIEPPTIVEGQPPIEQFQQALAPYGTWFQLPEWGWVWQPKEAVLNRDWKPYLDGGRWAWTDHGWYWESDYPWGWAGFHYGRWDEVENIGWVWFPDTVWGPSWVTWRYHENNMGWAPLPPNALAGNTVTEEQVYSNYDYGVPQEAYTFVDVHYIFVHDVRPHCLSPRRVQEFYPRCRVVNDYGPGRHHGVVNRGVPIERVTLATGRRHTAVPVFKGGTDRWRDNKSGGSPGLAAPTQHQQPVSPGFVGSRHDDRSGTRPNTLPAAPRLPAAPGTPGRSPSGNPSVAAPMNPIAPPINPSVAPMNPFTPPRRAPEITPAPPFRDAPSVVATPSSGSIPGQGHGHNKEWKEDRRRSHDATPTPPVSSPAVPAPGLTPAPPFRSPPPVQAATPFSGSIPAQGQNKEWKNDRPRSHDGAPTPSLSSPAIPAPGLTPAPSFRSTPPVQAATPHSIPGQGHGQNKEWKADRPRSHEAAPMPSAPTRPSPAPGFKPAPEVAARPTPAPAPQKQAWAAAPGPQQEHKNQERRNKK